MLAVRMLLSTLGEARTSGSSDATTAIQAKSGEQLRQCRVLARFYCLSRKPD